MSWNETDFGSLGPLGISGLDGSVPAISAAKWTTARALSFTGDATGSASVDGSADVATALTLATINSNVGAFGDATHVARITLDAKGRATAASAVAITFPVGIAATFGTGAPAAPGVTEGDMYYDTTLATYVAYVWHSAAWNQIA